MNSIGFYFFVFFYDFLKSLMLICMHMCICAKQYRHNIEILNLIKIFVINNFLMYLFFELNILFFI